MKYLITGITGFAGPHLARQLLKNGHDVHGMIRGSNGREMDLLDILDPAEIEAIPFHYAELTDYRSVSRVMSSTQYDGVFHLAAQSHPPTSFKDPVGTFSSNVQGTVNLIDAIQSDQQDCTLMFCSTSEVYGDTCKEVGTLKEEFALSPSNPYAASKAAIDLYMAERCKNGFIKGFITRAFSHTGPRRGKNFSISWDAYQLAAMKVGHKKGNVLPVGNLETQRIVIDVRDCVNAYYMLMQDYDNGQAYNVCGNLDHLKKMEYFTDKLIDISGLENIEKRISEELYRPVDIQVQEGDTRKLREKTDWAPKIDIDVTLRDLFDYWVQKMSR